MRYKVDIVEDICKSIGEQVGTDIRAIETSHGFLFNAKSNHYDDAQTMWLHDKEVEKYEKDKAYHVIKNPVSTEEVYYAISFYKNGEMLPTADDYDVFLFDAEIDENWEELKVDGNWQIHY